MRKYSLCVFFLFSSHRCDLNSVNWLKYSSSSSNSRSSAAVRFPNLIFRFVSFRFDWKHDETIASISFLIESFSFVLTIGWSFSTRISLGFVVVLTDFVLDFDSESESDELKFAVWDVRLNKNKKTFLFWGKFLFEFYDWKYSFNWFRRFFNDFAVW